MLNKKNTFMSKIRAFALWEAFADDVTVATPQGVTNGGVLFDDATRIVYSKEIEFKALPVMRFNQFATTKTELGTEPGMTISMLTYDNLKRGGALQEMKDMETQALSGSTKQITVVEYGNAVSVTELLVRTSFDDIMASTTTLLGRDYAQTLDCELRDAALSGSNVIYGKKTNGTVVTSRGDITADCTFKVSTVKDGIEILSTNNAPKHTLANNRWVSFLHPHQSRVLRDDPSWVEASKYGAPEQLFNGEIGRIDDTIFIETTIMCNSACAPTDVAYDSDLVATDGTKVFQSVLMGDSYYGIATALPVELRDDGVKDFGRKRSLAWYSIFGVAVLNDGYGVVIETA